MEIKNVNSVISTYKINGGYDNIKKESTDVSTVAKNYDKADFSLASRSRSVDNSKAEIKKSVKGFASAERIDSLKKMIAEGTYNIPAEAVAASIFEG